MGEHTPWRVIEDTDHDVGHFDIRDANDNRVAEVRNDYIDYNTALAYWQSDSCPMERYAKLIVQSVNAFAALAEHLGCKPEDLNVDLVQWYEAIKALKGEIHHLISIGCPVCGGDCSSANPPVISCPIKHWEALCDQGDEILAQFDTVDRADIAQTGEVALRTVKSSKKAGTVSRSAVKKAVRADKE